MSAVSSDDFGSLIAFASLLIFVLHNLIPSHDCLNPIWINRRCAKKQVTVYPHESTCLKEKEHKIKMAFVKYLKNYTL